MVKKPDTVEVGKEEYEELIRQNQENAALINQLVEKIDRVESAQLAGAGIDPKISARALLPRKRVQFLKHYSRCAIPSAIQKDALVVEAYSVSCGDIVDLREDEFKRINSEFPEMVEANPNKFMSKVRMVPRQVMDKNTGRMKIEWKNDPQTVEDLLKMVREVG